MTNETLRQHPDETALTTYLCAIAAELGLSPDDTDCEATDVTCGYVEFAGQSPDHPSRDMALTWDPANGWQIATTDGTSSSLCVIATLSHDARPTPHAVAVFVTDTVAALSDHVVRRTGATDRLTDLLDRHTGRSTRNTRRR
ncbi:DUF6292 family protein [Amycolatopsis sp. OK19-0408]|uniref:DUF6292 family protein n=1 Tax=Amycolatopsis iheyensis TaxID=2945988 RepID=A0A9X2NMG2_9PSEU|nr:DUF6292 family protein [Amycolatopsis iheyensis]MCR6490647.1 DUF6292 family protein [Amycolatopsis iheyensis]